MKPNLPWYSDSAHEVHNVCWMSQLHHSRCRHVILYRVAARAARFSTPPAARCGRTSRKEKAMFPRLAIPAAVLLSFALLTAQTRGSNCSVTSVNRTPINDLGTGLYLNGYQ